MEYNKLGVEHYYSFSSTLTDAQKREKLKMLVESNQYLFSEKIDGNLIRAIVSPTFNGLQTRGISKITGTYTEITDSVFFWDAIKSAFDDTTVLLGECFFEGGIDRNVSGVLRMKPNKAKSVQDKDYYEQEQQVTKFTPKDRRDITENEFYGIKLKYYIFDVLSFNGKDLLNAPIEERISYIPKAVERINSPLVVGAQYHECTVDAFYPALDMILNRGGEGCVMIKKGTKYEPDAKSARAWKTLKCKRELQETIDAFITGIVPAKKDFTGKDCRTCQWWENQRTGEILNGDYYNAYSLGENIQPVSKGYAFGWPGAIQCSVYDDSGTPVVIANVAGLTEDFKVDLKNNFDKYNMQPVVLSGMMVSVDAKTGRESGYSIRHPKLVSLRDDIALKDCTLNKILRRT